MTIVSPTPPDDRQVAAIRGLLDVTARADDRDPLSDQALTQVASPAVEHVLAYDGERLTGYAQLAGRSLEIAADPAAIGPLLSTFADRSVLVWSHGVRSRLVPVLRRLGFAPVRELHQMRRRLVDPIDAPPAPDGVKITSFVVGQDEAAWLRVNAAAFATHPEQGGWTRADLDAREHEPWFDPAGLLLAWRGAELVGFHWTKVHPNGAGEVYVIGVAPPAQGGGLGAVLLLRGLGYLSGRGCTEVLLYVDGSNTASIRLYERYGFQRHDMDVQWQSPHASIS